MAEKLKPEALFNVDYSPPKKGWMNTGAIDFEATRGNWNFAATPDSMKYLDMPNVRKWQPYEQDWQLPDDWQRILFEGFKKRLKRFRSLKVFMDICVRCGACADKCHFYLLQPCIRKIRNGAT